MPNSGALRSATLFTDGGSRGNPGEAGIGFVLANEGVDLHDTNGALAWGGAYIGINTNNVAEYSALIWGMSNALKLGIQNLTVQADSELIIKQLTGVYKIKHPDMKRLANQVFFLEDQFDQVVYRHVYRADNVLADSLANKGMDSQHYEGEGSYLIDAKSSLDFSSKNSSGLSGQGASAPALSPNESTKASDQRLSNSLSSANEEGVIQGSGSKSLIKNDGASQEKFGGARGHDTMSLELDYSDEPLTELKDDRLSTDVFSSISHSRYMDQTLCSLGQEPNHARKTVADEDRVMNTPQIPEVPMNTQGKRPVVVLGITGSIAAYKSCIVLRMLQKAGCDVHVVMTSAAQQFVTKLTFEELSGHPVLTDLFSSSISANPHITLAQMADVMVVVPATANLIAKLSNGIADDALSATILANTAPLLIAPAMNHRMYNHVATQTNLTTLAARDAVIIDPEQGDLACGETGVGRLADPAVIVDAILETLQG